MTHESGSITRYLWKMTECGFYFLRHIDNSTLMWLTARQESNWALLVKAFIALCAFRTKCKIKLNRFNGKELSYESRNMVLTNLLSFHIKLIYHFVLIDCRMDYYRNKILVEPKRFLMIDLLQIINKLINICHWHRFQLWNRINNLSSINSFYFYVHSILH